MNRILSRAISWKVQVITAMSRVLSRKSLSNDKIMQYGYINGCQIRIYVHVYLLI